MMTTQLFLFLALTSPLIATESGSQKNASDILSASGVQGGVVAHIGCGDGRLTAALPERFRLGNDGTVPSQQTEKRLASSTANYEFIETPLSEVLGFVSDAAQVEVHLNRRALGERDISADAPVSISLKDVKPRTALRLILDSVDKSLFFSVVDGVVVVSAVGMVE